VLRHAQPFEAGVNAPIGIRIQVLEPGAVHIGPALDAADADLARIRIAIAIRFIGTVNITASLHIGFSSTFGCK
jgi:hypothetical protein